MDVNGDEIMKGSIEVEKGNEREIEKW